MLQRLRFPYTRLAKVGRPVFAGFNTQDGSFDYVDCGDIYQFLVGDKWSAIAWFRRESSGDERCIISKWGVGTGTRQFELNIQNVAAPADLIFSFSATDAFFINNAIQDNTWYVAVASLDGGGASAIGRLVCFNAETGMRVGSATGAVGSDRTSTEPTRIGIKSTNSDEMDGDIAHVAVFHGIELSEEDTRLWIYDPQWVVMKHWQSCIGYWLGNENHGTRIEDLGPLGNHGTAQGSPTYITNPVLARPLVFLPFWSAEAAAAPPAGGPATGSLSLMGVGK